MKTFILCLIISSSLFSKSTERYKLLSEFLSNYKTSAKADIPISLDVNLKSILMGKISYKAELVTTKTGDKYDFLGVEFKRDDNGTSSLYQSTLMPNFWEGLNKTNLHSKVSLNFDKEEIELVNTDQKGEWFLKKAIGEKGITVKPVDGDFSKSKMLDLEFSNIRNQNGTLLNFKSVRLKLKEKGLRNFDVFYIDPKDNQEIKINDFVIGVQVTTLFQVRLSLKGNKGKLSLL